MTNSKNFVVRHVTQPCPCMTTSIIIKITQVISMWTAEGLRMRQENLFGAFSAILVFSARFCGFPTERSTHFCDIFWGGMKEYDKFTTISNSVDTRGVCWLFGWGYFNDQSANKTRKKAENLKFEIWFADDQDVHTRLQTLKVSLKMLMSYFYESRRGVWRRSWDIRFDNRR